MVRPAVVGPTGCCLGLSVVIGRGGEQINRIQLESGCKIQIAAGETYRASDPAGSWWENVFSSVCVCVCVCACVCVCVCALRQRWSSGTAMFSDGNS